MTQVFAAINHRLSEEYATIDLPDQEAKNRYASLLYSRQCSSDKSVHPRLLADAKFLHAKFSTLKGIGNPSTMLQTVVSEKSVARKSTPLSPKPSVPSANERIKGILSRRESGNYTSLDKALPTPIPSLPSSPPNGTPPIPGLNGSRDSFLGTPSRPSTPRTDAKPGFKQVAVPTSPDPRRPESPLPALPPDVGDITEPEPKSAGKTTELTPVDRPSRTSSLKDRTIESDVDARDGSAPPLKVESPLPSDHDDTQK